MQTMLMRQQERLDSRVQNIDEQLSKLETDKTLMKVAVSDLKERVRAQYKRMHALLEANQAESLQMLESTYVVYKRKNSQQVLQLNESHQEAAKLQNSVQAALQKADSLNVMKNTKPYKILMDRSNSYLSSSIPPLRVGQLNSNHLLSNLSARERNLRKMLEEPFSDASILESVQCHSSSSLAASSALQKRKYNVAFLEKNTENTTCQDSPPLLYGSKKPFMSADQSHRASSVYPSDVLSQNAHAGPGHSRLLDSSSHHIVGLGSSSSHHSGTMYPPSHFPGAGASQQATYGGRKVLMCTLNNCCCSGAPTTPARPSYPTLDTFPSMTSQEFASNAPLPANQSLQHFPMRGLMEASQTARHPDFYGLYSQSTTKHYGTK